MATVFKWLAGIFVGVLLLTGICLGVLMVVVDEDDVKTQLAEVVQRQTGGELTIAGKLGWSIFPQLGVSVDQLQFTPRDEQQTLASVGTARLGVDLMSLFRGQVNVDEVTLSGVRLDLIKHADGSGNWEKIQPEKTATTEPTQSTEPEQTPTDPTDSGGVQLAISTLNITDTEVNYRDQQSDTHYQLTDFSLRSNDVNLSGAPFPADIGFTANTPEASVTVDLQTRLSGDLEAQRFQLSELLSTIAVSGAATNGQTLTTNVATNATIDLGNEQATLQPLRIELANLIAAGQLSIAQLTSTPQISAALQSEAFNPRQLMQELGLEAPALSNAKALQHARFSTNISANANSASLDDIAIELDQTKITGSAAITDLSKQAISAQLAVDQINLDHYQMASSDNGAGASAGKSATGDANQAASKEPLLPLDTLRALNLTTSLNITTLVAGGMTLSDVNMKVNARDGLIKLSPLTARLYQGSTTTTASIDARSDNPAWAINTQVNAVQIGPLLTDAGDIDSIEGVFDFSGNLTSRGNNTYALKKKLKGPAKFTIKKGLLKGMNLEQTVCQGIALINQQSLNQSWGPDTKLKTIKGKIKFGDGKMVNQSLTGGLNNTKIKGSGDIDMLREDMEYKLGIRILGTMREVDPACEVNKRYRDIYWPLRCAGKLSEEPKDLCGIDEAAMGDIANKMLEQEVKQRAGDELEKKAKDELKRLFDRL